MTRRQRLRDALTRARRWVGGQLARVRGIVRFPARDEGEIGGGAYGESRARFWAGVDEGRREAQRRISGIDP